MLPSGCRRFSSSMDWVLDLRIADETDEKQMRLYQLIDRTDHRPGMNAFPLSSVSSVMHRSVETRLFVVGFVRNALVGISVFVCCRIRP